MFEMTYLMIAAMAAVLVIGGGVTGWMDASVHCKLLEQGSIWVHENLSPLHEYLIHISCVHVRQTERQRKEGYFPLSHSSSLKLTRLTLWRLNRNCQS